MDKMGELIFISSYLVVYRQDAGMGETDYCCLHNDHFFCRTDNRADMRFILASCFNAEIGL